MSVDPAVCGEISRYAEMPKRSEALPRVSHMPPYTFAESTADFAVADRSQKLRLVERKEGGSSLH